MQIILTKSFQKDASRLGKDEKRALFDVLLKLPSAVQDPLKHDGAGLRKIHHSGIFEARIGLALRMIFGYREGDLFLHRVGNHDEIKRYLRGL